MAIQTLGIRMLVQGAGKMASDLSHVALSLYAYSKAVSTAEKGMARFAQNNVNKAERTFQRIQKQIENTNKAMLRQQKIQDALNFKAANIPQVDTRQTQTDITKINGDIVKVKKLITDLNKALLTTTDPKIKAAMVSSITSLNNTLGTLEAKLKTTQVVLDKQNRTMDQTRLVAMKLNDSYNMTATLANQLTTQMSEQAVAATDLADKQAKLDKILDGSKGVVGTLSKFFGVLTGKFGEGVVGSTKLDTALLKMGLQASSVVLAINVLTIALDAIALVTKIVVGAVKLVWDVFAKLASMAYNAAKAVGSFVVNGLKKLVSIPFNIVVGGLRGIWESIKRIGEIAIGMNISNLIWNLGTKIKDLGVMAVDASANFQLLQIRLRGLINRELSKDGSSLAGGFAVASKRAAELADWISQLAVKSIFDAKTIANTISLAMAYDIEEKEAKTLTTAIVNFATGMGLGNDEMQRIIENFGQMKAAGKITGTELRDLSRGAFLPVNRVLEIMGKSLGLDTKKIGELRTQLQGMTTSGEISIDEFFKAFIKMSNTDFPDAVDAASTSWSVVTSNINDFIETVIGWRIITPTLNILSKRLSDFVSSFMTPEALKFASSFGKSIAFVASGVFKLSDLLTKKLFGEGGMGGILSPLNMITDGMKEYSDIFHNGAKASGDMYKATFKVRTGLGTLLGMVGRRDLTDKFFGLTRNLFLAFENIGNVPVEESVRTISTLLGDAWSTIWVEIVKPKVDEGWAKFKDWAKDWWTNSIQPALETLWEKDLAPWIKNLWEVVFPEFFKNTAGPELAKAVNGLTAWVLGTTIGKDVGSTITTSITSWLQANSGEGSVFFSAIASVMKSVFQMALSTGIEAILGGAEAYTNPKRKMGHAQADLENNDQTGTVSPLSKAIADLEAATERALNGSLARLRRWVEETGTPLNGLYTTFKNIESVVTVIATPLVSIAGSLERIAKAFSNNKSESSSSGLSGFASVMGRLGQIALNTIAIDLNFIATALEKVSTVIENMKEVNPALFKVFEGIGEMIMGRPAEGAASILNGLTMSVSAVFNSELGAILKDAQAWVTNMINEFLGLKDEVVTHSIVPDMMTEIYDVMTGKFTEINDWILPNFIDPFKLFFLPEDWDRIGTLAMDSLFSGIKRIGEQIAKWWSEFSSKFNLRATVTVDYPGSGGPKYKATDKNTPDLAKGANFIVPPGYPNDTFPINVQSGEHVIVIPKNVVLQSPKYKGVQGTSRIYGGMYNNSNTVVNKNYNLTVKSDVSPEMAIRQFGIMRLLDAE
jgi:tape measure domain-containing protein